MLRRSFPDPSGQLRITRAVCFRRENFSSTGLEKWRFLLKSGDRYSRFYPKQVQDIGCLTVIAASVDT